MVRDMLYVLSQKNCRPGEVPYVFNVDLDFQGKEMNSKPRKAKAVIIAISKECPYDSSCKSCQDKK